MRLGRILFLAVLVVLLGGSIAGAATINVSPGLGTPIQDAITAANDGDVIVLAPGNYNEEVTISGFHKLTITGAGPGVTTIDGTGLILIDDLVSIIDSELITIKNCTIDGAGIITHDIAVTNSDKVTIMNCIVESAASGIYSLQSNWLTVKSCTLKNNTGYGIYNSMVSNLKILASNITTNGTGILLSSCRNSLITKNLITYNTTNGFLNFNSKSTVLKQNRVSGNGDIGVFQSCWGLNANVYSKNVITENGSHGVYIERGLPTFIGNTITNNAGDGLHSAGYPTYTTLIKNTISNNDFHGFYMLDSCGYMSKNNISGHTASSAGIYQQLDTDSSVPAILTLANNKLTGNDFGVELLDNTSLPGSGVLNAEKNFCAANVKGVVITNEINAFLDKNKITANILAGIESINSHGQTITRNLVYGNMGTGISSGFDSLIYKNKIANNAGPGIYGFDTSHVAGNVVLTNAENGIDGSGGSGSLVESNKAFGNGNGISTFDLYDNGDDDEWIYNKAGTTSLP